MAEMARVYGLGMVGDHRWIPNRHNPLDNVVGRPGASRCITEACCVWGAPSHRHGRAAEKAAEVEALEQRVRALQQEAAELEEARARRRADRAGSWAAAGVLSASVELVDEKDDGLFQPLGDDPALPSYLRATAPVRNLQLTWVDARALVLDLWREKLASPQTMKLKMPEVRVACDWGVRKRTSRMSTALPRSTRSVCVLE